MNVSYDSSFVCSQLIACIGLYFWKLPIHYHQLFSLSVEGMVQVLIFPLYALSMSHVSIQCLIFIACFCRWTYHIPLRFWGVILENYKLSCYQKTLLSILILVSFDVKAFWLKNGLKIKPSSCFKWSKTLFW